MSIGAVNTKGNKRVVFNVSGEIFETFEKTLMRFPETLLGTREKREKYYSEASKEYFFDKRRQCFEAILFYYQSWGMLRCPPNVPLDLFVNECEFFEIPSSEIEAMKFNDGILTGLLIDGSDKSGTFRARIWNIVEHPETSFIATVYGVISLLAIVASIVCAILETVPSLKVKSGKFSDNHWAQAELVINSWFLLEIIIRLASCPKKISFIFDWLNFVDMLAVVPYFFMFIIAPELNSSLGFLRILRLVRILRLFKFSKHSTRLKVVGKIVSESVGDLQLLMLCLCILILLAGSCMYFLEPNKDTDYFKSIPQSLWWGVITVTTVGYGDVFPLTTPGKLFSACFMAFGALTLTLPVLSIVTKFMLFYERNVELQIPVNNN